MSWKVATLCSERRFGSPVRKQIIMYLADKASDDGSGIWCSKGTIARQTELGETTVKRAISEFLSEGVLVETGRRACMNGYTAIYRIDLDAVGLLEAICDPNMGTGSRVDGVRCGPGRGASPDGVPGPQRTPNNPKTIRKPPTRGQAREEEVVPELEKAWKAYPADRRRDQRTSLERMRQALSEISPDELIAAVRAYAVETEGFTRSKVSFSDNWLRDEKWRRHIDDLRRRKAETEAAAEKQLGQIAAWVKARHGMCKHLTKAQVVDAVERGLISRQEAHAAGVMR
ncbi:hypothetical protein ACFOMH_07525 [Paracoccus mangrovi]|uniref:Helix-turn-helix domain-containing protein n=1 Tax=Paracoccus mangrovi TaxID=1715645 RepID=A0ABV7R2T8_9RHOB